MAHRSVAKAGRWKAEELPGVRVSYAAIGGRFVLRLRAAVCCTVIARSSYMTVTHSSSDSATLCLYSTKRWVADGHCCILYNHQFR